LCHRLDIGLSGNSAYHYARSLDQLKVPSVKLLEEAEVDARIADYNFRRTSAGQRLGDIKASTLNYAG
jgi:hypothetical protein